MGTGKPKPPRSQASSPRTDRGRARREAILEAAIEVVARDGVGAVTHRAVAAEAGVPLAATTYYFASKFDLLLAAFRQLTEQRMRALDEALVILPDRMSPELAAAGWAHALAENLRTEPARVLSEFEMHLEASRRPELRAIHEAWEGKAMQYFTAGMKALGSPHPEADAALVLAVLTGLEIGELASPTPQVERDLLAPLLRRLLHALAPATG
jgi:TetR/AcrR family transcriptional regulator, regulator of biofilm formation and stress response